MLMAAPSEGWCSNERAHGRANQASTAPCSWRRRPRDGASMSDAAAGGIESAARPEGARPQHYPCFDGLRAIAALTIVVTHVYAATVASVPKPLEQFFARFDIGVAIFFVISGFLLYRPFAAAHLDGRPGPAVAPFLRRRFVRIFPAYWVVLVIALLTVDHGHGLWTILSFFGLLHIYDPQLVLGPPALVESGHRGELLRVPAPLRRRRGAHRADPP